MLAAIAFDNKAKAEADEIDDVGAYRLLAAEFDAREVGRAKKAPQRHLSVGGVAAELTGA